MPVDLMDLKFVNNIYRWLKRYPAALFLLKIIKYHIDINISTNTFQTIHWNKFKKLI